jgi:negative regulator of replication initiation
MTTNKHFANDASGERADQVLRRMLSTPPVKKPPEPSKKKKPAKGIKKER